MQASGECCRTELPAEVLQPVVWSCLWMSGQRRRLRPACGASGCSGGFVLACCLTAQAAAAAGQGSAGCGELPDAGGRGVPASSTLCFPADARLCWQDAAGPRQDLSWLGGGKGCGSCPPGGKPAWPLPASSHRRPCTRSGSSERFVQLPPGVRKRPGSRASLRQQETQFWQALSCIALLRQFPQCDINQHVAILEHQSCDTALAAVRWGLTLLGDDADAGAAASRSRPPGQHAPQRQCCAWGHLGLTAPVPAQGIQGLGIREYKVGLRFLGI